MNKKFFVLSLIFLATAAQFNASQVTTVVKKTIDPALKVVIGSTGIVTAAVTGYVGYQYHTSDYQIEKTVNAIKWDAERFNSATEKYFDATSTKTIKVINNVKAKIEKWNSKE